VEARMSCIEYDNVDPQQAVRDYLYEENDMPIPIAYKAPAEKQSIQPQISKSPVPNIYNNMVGTPTSMSDLRISHQ
jgi:hypothetical protein